MTRASRPAVLIVEDEPLIRTDAVEMIAEAGFRTYAAGCSEEALALLERHDDVAFLFTDIEMPGTMDGLKLAALVRRRWPAVRILIASGAFEAKQADMPDHALFYAKPYAIGRITDALHAMADDPA